MDQLDDNNTNQTLDAADFWGLEFANVNGDDPYLQTVAVLELYDAYVVSGNISSSAIAKLPDLERLYFVATHLTGTFPDICPLKKLAVVYVHGTKLEGTIPDCTGNLTSIQTFELKGTDQSSSGPLIFDSSIIEMWCANGNDLTALSFDNIDYRFVAVSLCPSF